MPIIDEMMLTDRHLKISELVLMLNISETNFGPVLSDVFLLFTQWFCIMLFYLTDFSVISVQSISVVLIILIIY